MLGLKPLSSSFFSASSKNIAQTCAKEVRISFPVSSAIRARSLSIPRQTRTYSKTARKAMSSSSVRSSLPAQERPRAEAIPYSGPPVIGVAPDLVLNDVLHLNEDEKYWVPQLENVWYRPLLFNLTQGYWVNLLRVRKSGILSRHRHSGPVHAATLKGRWHYLEHEWWATPGSYSFEPPGDTHTLEVPEGVEEMVTLFHVTGSYTYCEPDGTAIGVEDVHTQYQTALEHYEKVGLGEDYIKSLVR